MWYYIRLRSGEYTVRLTDWPSAGLVSESFQQDDEMVRFTVSFACEDGASAYAKLAEVMRLVSAQTAGNGLDDLYLDVARCPVGTRPALHGMSYWSRKVKRLESLRVVSENELEIALQTEGTWQKLSVSLWASGYGFVDNTGAVWLGPRDTTKSCWDNRICGAVGESLKAWEAIGVSADNQYGYRRGQAYGIGELRWRGTETFIGCGYIQQVMLPQGYNVLSCYSAAPLARAGSLRPFAGWILDDFTSLRPWWDVQTSGSGTVTVSGGAVRMYAPATADAACMSSKIRWPHHKACTLKERFAVAAVAAGGCNVFRLTDNYRTWRIGSAGNVVLNVGVATSGALNFSYTNTGGTSYYYNPGTGAWQTGSATAYTISWGTIYRLIVESDGTAVRFILQDDTGTELVASTWVNWSGIRACATNAVWGFGDYFTGGTNAIDLYVYGVSLELHSGRIGILQQLSTAGLTGGELGDGWYRLWAKVNVPADEGLYIGWVVDQYDTAAITGMMHNPGSAPWPLIRRGEIGVWPRRYVHVKSSVEGDAAFIATTQTVNRANAFTARVTSRPNWVDISCKHFAIASWASGSPVANPSRWAVQVREWHGGLMHIVYYDTSGVAQYWTGSAWSSTQTDLLTTQPRQRRQVEFVSNGTSWYVKVYDAAGSVVVDTSSVPIAWASTYASAGVEYICAGDLLTTQDTLDLLIEQAEVTGTGWAAYTGLPSARWDKAWQAVVSGGGVVEEWGDDDGWLQARAASSLTLAYELERANTWPAVSVLAWVMCPFSAADAATGAVLSLGVNPLTSQSVWVEWNGTAWEVFVSGASIGTVTYNWTPGEWFPLLLRVDSAGEEIAVWVGTAEGRWTRQPVVISQLPQPMLCGTGNFVYSWGGIWEYFLSDEEVTAWASAGRMACDEAIAYPGWKGSYIYQRRNYAGDDNRTAVAYMPGTRATLFARVGSTQADRLWLGCGPMENGYNGWYEAERGTLGAIASRVSLDTASGGEIVRITPSATGAWQSALEITVLPRPAWYRVAGRWRVIALVRDNGAATGTILARIRDGVSSFMFSWYGAYFEPDGVAAAEIGVWKWLDLGEVVWPPDVWADINAGVNLYPSDAVSPWEYPELKLYLETYRVSGTPTLDIDVICLVPAEGWAEAWDIGGSGFGNVLAVDGIAGRVYAQTYWAPTVMVLDTDKYTVSNLVVRGVGRSIVQVLWEMTSGKVAPLSDLGLMMLAVLNEKAVLA